MTVDIIPIGYLLGLALVGAMLVANWFAASFSAVGPDRSTARRGWVGLVFIGLAVLGAIWDGVLWLWSVWGEF